MRQKGRLGNPWLLSLLGIVTAAFLLMSFSPRGEWLRGTSLLGLNQDEEKPHYPRNPRANIKTNKDYSLHVWVELPSGSQRSTEYKTWLDARLQQFTVDWPRISVEKRYFSGPAVAMEAMTLALAAGDPPDLYLPSRSISSVPRELIGWDLALPIRPYLTDEVASEYHPAVLSLAGEEPLAWPWAIAVESWLAHASMTDRATTGGAASVKQKLSAWQEEYGSLPLGILPMGVRTIDGLMVASMGQARDPVNFLGDLATSGLARMRSGLLDDWVEKRVGVLAGVSPRLQEMLLPHLKEKDQAVWLPLPSLNDRSAQISPQAADWYGVFVFRKKEYAGDDQSRAAVELARFVTRETPPWLPNTPMVVGAFRPRVEENAASTASARLESPALTELRSAGGYAVPNWLVDGLAQPERWHMLPFRTDQEQVKLGELISDLLQGKSGDQAQKLVKELENLGGP